MDLKAFLHRGIWQRLPYDFRRNALFRTTSFIAPRPTSNARPAEPIIVVGALTAATGLGESARLCHDALKAAGRNVYGIDVSSTLRQLQQGTTFEFADGRHLTGSGTLVVHVNAPFMPLVMSTLTSKLVRGKYVVGYWAWELPDVPSEWRFGLPFVHDVWVPSVFTANAIAKVFDPDRIHVLPHPVCVNAQTSPSSSPSTSTRTRSDETFRVLSIFNMASSFSRKNPLAAIEAFRRAFGDDPTTHLTLKASSASSFPPGRELIDEAVAGAGNMTFIDATQTVEDLRALYNSTNALLSLHRSEGFGLTLAEAMMSGVPVVASDWSSNVDFLTEERGIPVPCQLIPAEDAQGTYQYPEMVWADPDLDYAAEALRSLRADPERAGRLAANAEQFAMTTWSAESYADRVSTALDLKS